MKTAILAILTLVMGYAAFAIAGRFVQLHTVYNSTTSEPIGNYWIHPTRELKRGGYVLACMPAAGLRELEQHHFSPPRAATSTCPGGVVPLVKTIVALPGDSIRVDSQGVFVNGSLLPGTQPLRGWRTIGAQTVPMGHIFALGQGADSFDCRYFGSVVPQAALSWLPF